MQILETRDDGSLLCVLTAEEAALVSDRPLPIRKWAVRVQTQIRGVYASLKDHDHVIKAQTREEAEAEGVKRALHERARGATLVDVGAKDVTGKTLGFFGNWS